ncbi:MAG: hypothetical protein AAF512_23010 [Pseudomonadota bacterium]
MTEATEEISPKIKGKKFTVGLCPNAAKSLPVNWLRNDDRIKLYVRDVIMTDDVELIWTNEIDCLIRAEKGPYQGLKISAVNHSDNAGELYLICKPGFIDCLQMKEILSELQNAIA